MLTKRLFNNQEKRSSFDLPSGIDRFTDDSQSSMRTAWLLRSLRSESLRICDVAFAYWLIILTIDHGELCR